MSGLCLQHSFRSLRLSDIIFNLDKATLRVPRYESEVGVSSRYSDLEKARRLGVQTPVGSRYFLFPTSVWIGQQWVRGSIPGSKAVRRGFDRPTAPSPTLISSSAIYRGADKSLARPGRKQATATEDFEFHISYL